MSAEAIEHLIRVLRETRTFPVLVRLTPDELAEATAAGEARQRLTGHLPDAHGLRAAGDPHARHIEGCKAELAFSRATGQPWTAVVEDYRTLAGNDVGPFGIRSTSHRSGGLILHDSDEDDRVFVLVVTAEEPDFWLRGWVNGARGKNPDWWETEKFHSPAYRVPQSSLSITPPEGMFL